MSLNGVLVVNKPVGPTSHDVVSAARRALGEKRIGHTGTLDPAASGVLPLVVGQATRLAQYLTATDKEYEATIQFGVETDTYDAAGRVVRETGQMPAREALIEALDRFRGTIDQVPPAYSAKKVDGERAYDRARRAMPVTLTPVEVRVDVLELIAYEPPLATLRIVSSPGFYVRSLAHDLGAAVGTGATLHALVRRRSGDFSLEDAVAFDELVRGTPATIAGRMVPMERLLTGWPAVELKEGGLRKVAHGQDLGPADWVGPPPPVTAALVRLLSPDRRLAGIATRGKTAGFLHPTVVFR